MPLSLFLATILSIPSSPLPLRNPHARHRLSHAMLRYLFLRDLYLPYRAYHAIPRKPRHTTQTTLFRNRRRVQAERGGVRACGARGEAGSGSAGGEQKRPRGCRSSPQRRRLIRKRPAPHRVGRFFVSLYGVPWGSFAPFFSFAPRSVLPLNGRSGLRLEGLPCRSLKLAV